MASLLNHHDRASLRDATGNDPEVTACVDGDTVGFVLHEHRAAATVCPSIVAQCRVSDGLTVVGVHVTAADDVTDAVCMAGIPATTVTMTTAWCYDHLPTIFENSSLSNGVITNLVKASRYAQVYSFIDIK